MRIPIKNSVDAYYVPIGVDGDDPAPMTPTEIVAFLRPDWPPMESDGKAIEALFPGRTTARGNFDGARPAKEILGRFVYGDALERQNT